MPPEWAAAIDEFIRHLRAKGQPATTQRARIDQLRHLARRSPVASPWDLKYRQLEEYFAEQTWAQNTRRGRRDACVLFWRWGRKRGYCRKNIGARLPIVPPKKPLALPVPVPVYEAAMRRADERTRLVLRMAKEAGMRRGEIAVAGSWDLIEDLVGWSIIVHGKGNKDRLVPLTPRLALELRTLGEGHFFPGAINGHLSPRRVGELADDVLAEPWTLHKLRSRFATDALEESGGDYGLVQELLGHATPNTTKAYVPVDQSRMRRVVEAAAQPVPNNVRPLLAG
ncbi:tyrosine-type recombinase/integrase [Microbacterium rhizophilus]|uniref:tyrosine-type recombinase/integrase n=1 Tax=Microbacterium rhizophilus TaxID=3138934 RepID=UPI0031E5D992